MSLLPVTTWRLNQSISHLFIFYYVPMPRPSHNAKHWNKKTNKTKCNKSKVERIFTVRHDSRSSHWWMKCKTNENKFLRVICSACQQCHEEEWRKEKWPNKLNDEVGRRENGQRRSTAICCCFTCWPSPKKKGKEFAGGLWRSVFFGQKGNIMSSNVKRVVQRTTSDSFSTRKDRHRKLCCARFLFVDLLKIAASFQWHNLLF